MPASRFAAWVGARTEAGVTRVTKVSETPNPSVSAALEAATEVTRAAEPKVTGVTARGPSAMEVTQVTQRPTTRLLRKPPGNQHSNQGNPSSWLRSAAGRQSFALGKPRPLRTFH